MAIEVGQLAFVRSTEEPVMVLNILGGMQNSPHFADVDSTKFSGSIALVRRPKLTDQGIIHINDTFLVEELESRSDKEQRVFNEMEGIKAQFNTTSRAVLGPAIAFPETKN